MRLRFLLLPIALTALAGCDLLDFADHQRVTEDFHHSYPLKPGGRLSVENHNGAVEISGWDQDTVEISGTKFAHNEETLKAMRIDIAATPDSVLIRTIRPVDRRVSSGAKYSIRVPRRTILERVVSTNGHIRAEGVESGARLKTSNGAVRVYHVNGAVDVTTSNGTVEIDSVDGDVVLRTSNGRVRADDVRGAIDASTTNGSITVDVSKPQPSRRIRLQTSNGGVELTLNELNQNEVEASTSNGSITVRLPATAGARLTARTSKSRIETDFDVKTPGLVDKNRLEGMIGAGGPLVDLSTSNGAIRVLKL
jgi:DUF4097 and DUF4098 domain-containing protein YvlB